jgi:nucleoid-associated protein YgaU
MQLLQLRMVAQGDRLDTLSAAAYGDPELFWRIADANEAFDPDELTQAVGRVLRITLPQGMEGAAV